jgi:very-short-patch-repair endonuclease
MPDRGRVSWTDTAHRQAGLITRAQLRAHGVSARTIDNWQASGRLERTLTGALYRVAGSPDTADRPVWWAVLSTDSPLSYLSAARWWDVPVPEDGWVHITRFDRRRLAWPHGIRVHRVALERTATTRHRGLLVTTRVETVLDCLGWLALGRARVLRDRACQQGWITSADVARRLDLQPGRWGNRQLRLLLREWGDGAAAESERILHRLLKAAGITGWVANLPVVVAGQRFDIDVAFPERRLAIEVDGFAYHSGDERFQRDRTRQNALIAAGWQVLRFTWADLTERPHEVVGRVAQLLAA